MKKKTKNKKKNKILIILGIIIVIGIIYYLYNNVLGAKFKKVKIDNNYSIEYSNKMIKELYDKKKNIIYSDLTVNQGLAFLYSLGNDSVQNEMNNYFMQSEEALNDNYNKISSRYKNAYNRVNVSGSLWVNSKKSGLSKEAKNKAKELKYSLKEKDFSKSSTSKNINKWVKKKSHNKIDYDIGDISESHSVIINTLYFHEKWEVPYKSSEIINDTFYGTNGDSNVSYLESEEYNYMEDDNALGFMKRYKDEDLYFVGIKPKEDKTISDINLNSIFSSRQNIEVKVRIPEFEYEYEVLLNDKFKNLGVESIFTPGNLEKIAEDLYVDKIIQKNYIKVDRNGTEAFSVSSTINQQWSMGGGKTEIYLDHPFIFLIYDDSIDQVLFIGQVNNI